MLLKSEYSHISIMHEMIVNTLYYITNIFIHRFEDVRKEEM